jgi:hypothetical protein
MPYPEKREPGDHDFKLRERAAEEASPSAARPGLPSRETGAGRAYERRPVSKYRSPRSIYSLPFLLAAAALVATIVLVAVIAMRWGLHATPESAVRAYFDAFKSGDGAAMYDLMSSRTIEQLEIFLQTFRAMTLQEKQQSASMMGISPQEMDRMSGREFFIHVIGMWSKQGMAEMIPDYEIVSVHVESDRATVEVAMDEPYGTTAPISLVRETGGWKIDEGMGF